MNQNVRGASFRWAGTNTRYAPSTGLELKGVVPLNMNKVGAWPMLLSSALDQMFTPTGLEQVGGLLADAVNQSCGLGIPHARHERVGDLLADATT